MNLKKLPITILADGFRIEDKGANIPNGARLEVRYELSNGWITNVIEFEREPRSLRHPLRRSMFIYTGFRPIRVLVRLADAERQKKTVVRDRGSFYRDNNFASYPEFHDIVWQGDDFAHFFFLNEPEPQHEFVGGGGEFGGAGASGEWTVEDAAPALKTEDRLEDIKAVPPGEEIPAGFGFFPASEAEKNVNGAADVVPSHSASEVSSAPVEEPAQEVPAVVDPLDAAVAACASVSEVTEPGAASNDEPVSELSTSGSSESDTSEPNAY